MFCFILLIVAYAFTGYEAHQERKLRNQLHAHGRSVPIHVLRYRQFKQASTFGSGGNLHVALQEVCHATYTLRYPNYGVSDIFYTGDYGFSSNVAFCRYLQNNVGKELSAATLDGTRGTTRLRNELPLVTSSEILARPASWIFMFMVALICYVATLYFTARPRRKKKKTS